MPSQLSANTSHYLQIQCNQFAIAYLYAATRFARYYDTLRDVLGRQNLEGKAGAGWKTTLT